MRVSSLRVVLLGSCEPVARQFVERALLQLPRSTNVERVVKWSADWLRHAAHADLCVVFQSWPDEIPTGDARRLIASCATGRLICCQGAWCASDGRTRAVWPPAVCVPVEQLASRLAFELSVLSGDVPPVPATASRDEAFLAHYAPRTDEGEVVASIRSPDPVYARELRRVLNSTQRREAPACEIIDVDQVGPPCAARIEPAAVAVAGFPRPDDVGRWLAAGTREVVPKLAPLSELQSAIRRAAAAGPSETGPASSR